MEEGKRLTILGMLLIAGVIALVLVAIHYSFGRPASASGNSPQCSQETRAEES